MNDEQEAQLAMFMRVIEVFRKHNDDIKDQPELVAAVDEVKNKVQQIFNLLSEEERDRALEKYNEDMAYLKDQA